MITIKTYQQLTGRSIPTIRKDISYGYIRTVKVGKLLFLDDCSDLRVGVAPENIKDVVLYPEDSTDFSLKALLKYRRIYFKTGYYAPALKTPKLMTLEDYATKTGRSRPAVVLRLPFTDHVEYDGYTFIRELEDIDYDALHNARRPDNIWKDHANRPWHPDTKNRLLIRTLARFTDSDLYIFREFFNELYSLM